MRLFNNIKKVIFCFTILIIVFLCFLSVANASTGSTSVSGSSSLVVGNSTTLTIKFSGTNIFAGNTYISIDNPNVISISGSGKGNLDSFMPGESYLWEGSMNGSSSLYFTITVYAKSAGTAKISISTEGATDSNGDPVSYGSTSYTIRVNNPAKSGNCNLQNITTSQGELYPSFSTDVTSYSVTVDYSIEEVVLGYSVSGSGATAKLIGSNSVKVGENKRSIVVTAENGTTKEYTVNVIRADEDGTLPDGTNFYQIKKEKSLGLIINEINYMILDDFSGIKIPEGFIEDVISYNGFDIPVLHPKKTNIYIAFATSQFSNNILSASNSTEDVEASTDLDQTDLNEEENNGVWLFYDANSGQFTDTYKITTREILDQTNYLLYGDDEPIVEPEPSSFYNQKLYITAGVLALLFITIIVLEITILVRKKKTKKEETLNDSVPSLEFRSNKRKG